MQANRMPARHCNARKEWSRRIPRVADDPSGLGFMGVIREGDAPDSRPRRIDKPGAASRLRSGPPSPRGRTACLSADAAAGWHASTDTAPAPGTWQASFPKFRVGSLALPAGIRKNTGGGTGFSTDAIDSTASRISPASSGRLRLCRGLAPQADRTSRIGVQAFLSHCVSTRAAFLGDHAAPSVDSQLSPSKGKAMPSLPFVLALALVVSPAFAAEASPWSTGGDVDASHVQPASRRAQRVSMAAD
jgi:hypothetical protein